MAYFSRRYMEKRLVERGNMGRSILLSYLAGVRKSKKKGLEDLKVAEFEEAIKEFDGKYRNGK